MFRQFKESFTYITDKIRGHDSSSRQHQEKRYRNPQEILEEIKPHFVKTLSSMEGDEAKSWSRSYRQQQNAGSGENEDVRMTQNGSQIENQFVPKPSSIPH